MITEKTDSKVQNINSSSVILNIKRRIHKTLSYCYRIMITRTLGEHRPPPRHVKIISERYISFPKQNGSIISGLVNPYPGGDHFQNLMGSKLAPD